MFKFRLRFYIKLRIGLWKKSGSIVFLKNLTSIFLLFLSVFCFAAEGLVELTEEELARYQFESDETPAMVKDLSLGQRYALNAQRREVTDLISRRIGIMGLKGDVSDLKTLQSVVDRKVINLNDVRQWQSLGIVFGDVLAKEFNLHWVSYEDDLGISKVLRWRKTDNFVFPVTLFSKRIHFKEQINVVSIYDKISVDIQKFKAYENNRPVFK